MTFVVWRERERERGNKVKWHFQRRAYHVVCKYVQMRNFPLFVPIIISVRDHLFLTVTLLFPIAQLG
ncbi:hypothetical protein K501DRAFT_29969 [Backusella circina FSU 941]|nr:hypothetical protein K501DRAFT_29969 [Backusella circina FSU 941]